ncbi:unnamed protein product (macronuclear) [Paramecium tetraurelia]|uniref:Palmitoyltransferase n=1 Tax=Paramecium tetraurelia TaxID=5888 RepID=A0BY34_PARTE|nr:uncharacterized protein GSPATT00033304001 [Paramecium tetraurelia]CAK63451.1 unnamed protein product [Paramecium tetraurelia]|eukprot:XP_001430849.1 hypothetical protein (macronuclear) [Paramecium tetraurelia strain d4-2]
MIMFTLIFYGFTAFKDPGFVTISDYQYTDSSNPYQKKRQSFHPLPGNSQLRTKEQVPEERVDLKVVEQAKEKPKNKDEFEMECEASVDEQNFPDNDIHNMDNNAKSYEKTPEKSRTPSKMVSQMQSPHQNNARTSQVLSQGSTKPDINNNNNPNTQTEPQFNYQQEINVEQVEHQQSPKSANNDKNIDQSVHHGNSMFIEKRYCPICNQDQIIRSKHCRKCNRCIALYDHHCPWTSNCIGERNRCVFYWFLFFQIQEIIYVMRAAFPHLDFSQYSGWFSLMVIISIIVSILMGLMVLSLFLFHSLLTCKNMTTWEYKSWKRISYLKDFPQQLGSPFSSGWKQNLRQYCRFSVPKLTNWEYNTQNLNFIK